MKKFWKKVGNWIITVPWYGWVFGVLMIVFDVAAYAGAKGIIYGCGWLDNGRAIIPKIPGLDNAIPLCPYFWAEIYIISFPFWFFGPVVASRTSRQNFLNYVIGLFVAYLIGFAVFVGVPTYMDRAAEGIIDAANKGSGLSWWIMRTTLFFDGSKINLNLLPSFHCLISLYCYLGVYKRKEIHLWYRIFAIVLTILISFSTVFTKQHYIIDVPFGLLLAVFTWWLTKLIKPGERMVKKWPYIFALTKKQRQNYSKLLKTFKK